MLFRYYGFNRVSKSLRHFACGLTSFMTRLGDGCIHTTHNALDAVLHDLPGVRAQKGWSRFSAQSSAGPGPDGENQPLLCPQTGTENERLYKTFCSWGPL